MRSSMFLTCCLIFSVCVGAGYGAIYDADFNAEPLGPLGTQPVTDPTPRSLPTSIIRDSGCLVDVVASAGNLTDQPVVCDPAAGGLSSVVFYLPEPVSTGTFQMSWDSAILSDPVLQDLNQDQIWLGTRDGIFLVSVWGIKYNTDGTFVVNDSTGFHSFGSFAVGVSDHFDLTVDLDSNAYDLLVNGNPAISGSLEAPGTIDKLGFHANARGGVDVASLAFDNVVMVPEPATMFLLSLGGLALRRRR